MNLFTSKTSRMVLASLQRRRPDLAAKVQAGEQSLNAALIAAGFRTPHAHRLTVSLPPLIRRAGFPRQVACLNCDAPVRAETPSTRLCGRCRTHAEGVELGVDLRVLAARPAALDAWTIR
jgi:Zn finger protein HypA/HybF involved in hydrogenase expression